MATYEQDIAMFETKENGDKVIKLPITRANNVEGIGRSASTAYVVGDVVYVDNNKKVALKCTQAGTTSSGELDVSSKAIGNTVSDGSVKWQVCNRTSDVTSVNGQTGDVSVGKITDASISGKVITLIFADGTTKTLTTQDTVTSAAVSAYKIPYATCSTATSTAAKVATISNGVNFSLVAGAIVAVTTTNTFNASGNTSTTALTLNVNSTGAKNITLNGNNIAQNQSTLRSAKFILFVYTGSTYEYLAN